MKKGKSLQCSKDIANWFGRDDVTILSEGDPNKFIKAEAKAASLECSKKEAKKKVKKSSVRTQGEKAPINFENMKKRWGKWYVFGLNENGQDTAKCKACSTWYVGIRRRCTLTESP